MTIEKLKKLGWKREDTANNRDFYFIGDSKYSIFEHNGEFGLVDGIDLLYCNLSNEEIVKFTNLVKTSINIESHPKDFSLYDYLTNLTELLTFIKEKKE